MARVRVRVRVRVRIGLGLLDNIVWLCSEHFHLLTKEGKKKLMGHMARWQSNIQDKVKVRVKVKVTVKVKVKVTVKVKG